MNRAAVGLFRRPRWWPGAARRYAPANHLDGPFVLVEEWVEGDRGARILLTTVRARPVVLQEAAKHAVWMLIAAVTGGPPSSISSTHKASRPTGPA